MNIKIIRHHKTSEVIDGTLTIDGIYVCDTAENAHAAVPEGIYPLSLIRCKQYPLSSICLIDRPPCKKCKKIRNCNNNTVLPCHCPMIKPGNGVYKRLDGSIIVGENIVPGCLEKPFNHYKRLHERIRKSLKRGNSVTLIIKD